MESVAILGTGGHSKSVMGALAWRWSYREGGFATPIKAIPIGEAPDNEARLIHGMSDIAIRRALTLKYGRARFMSVIHKSAIIGYDVKIGMAVQVHAGAVIQPRATLHDFAIINTGAIVDHDAIVGEFSFIAPGAILLGGVELGPNCEIGAGAMIIQGVKLNAGTKIPAGALVVGQGDVRRPSRMVSRDGAAAG